MAWTMLSSFTLQMPRKVARTATVTATNMLSRSSLRSSATPSRSLGATTPPTSVSTCAVLDIVRPPYWDSSGRIVLDARLPAHGRQLLQPCEQRRSALLRILAPVADAARESRGHDERAGASRDDHQAREHQDVKAWASPGHHGAESDPP